MKNEITNFITNLRKDSTVRKQEVRVLQQSWKNSANDIYNKCIILMLYAHFEGFIIQSCNKLIEHIIDTYKDNYSNLPNNYKYLLLAEHIPENITHFTKRVNAIQKILEKFTELDQTKFYKRTFKPIAKITKSNIGYDNFWEIITILGLSQEFLKTIETNNLNKSEDCLNSLNIQKITETLNDLRDIRNDISHTGHGSCSSDAVTSLSQSTFNILDVLIDTIEQYVLSIKTII